MLIEKIFLKTKTNLNVFIVVIDGEDNVLHSETIVKYGICTGGEIEKEKLDEIKLDSDIIIATNLAMKYISSRLITTKQLKDYLKTKGFSTHVIKNVIDKFNEYGVLDDNVYASSFVSSKQSSLSKRAIQNKLMQKGVNKELIEQNISELDDYDVAIKTCEKFMKNKIFTEDNIAKLIRHLNYKGFDFETINKVLENYKRNL